MNSIPVAPSKALDSRHAATFRVVRSLAVGILLAVSGLLSASASVRAIYSAGFESPAFDPVYSLDDQSGWVVAGTGGTGLFVDGIFQGPSAFVGLFPPTNTNTETSAWFPLDMDPIARGEPLVRFSVDFVIWDSTTNAPFGDEFRWSAVNRAGEPLCELLFDAYTFQILSLGGGASVPVDTAQRFVTNGLYRLSMTLDFLSNRWSASLSNHVTRSTTVLVAGAVMAGPGQALDLGDIDASWVVSDVLNPGDNFMEFDNYSVVTEGPGLFSVAVLPASSSSAPRVRVAGETGQTFVLEAAAALGTSLPTEWIPFATNRVSGGILEAVDSAAAGAPSRFYRARWVP